VALVSAGTRDAGRSAFAGRHGGTVTSRAVAMTLGRHGGRVERLRRAPLNGRLLCIARGFENGNR
jgi:hypothetical protein